MTYFSIEATPPKLSETWLPTGNQMFNSVSLGRTIIKTTTACLRDHIDCILWNGKTCPLWVAPSLCLDCLNGERELSPKRTCLSQSVSWLWACCDPQIQAPATLIFLCNGLCLELQTRINFLPHVALASELYHHNRIKQLKMRNFYWQAQFSLSPRQAQFSLRPLS